MRKRTVDVITKQCSDEQLIVLITFWKQKNMAGIQFGRYLETESCLEELMEYRKQSDMKVKS